MAADDAQLLSEIHAMLADIRAAAASPPAPVAPAPLSEPSKKALDRRRWYEKATNALARGGACDVPFDPEYLTDSEAMTIRAALKRAATADDVWRAVGAG